MKKDLQQRESWTSRMGFILAAAGSAVGLGNIWRFPYIAGTNGGAAFLLVFLAAVILIGYPLMVTEMTLGRKTHRNPIGAFKSLAPNTPWWLVGALSVFTALAILSYYSVIAGWSLSYIFKALSGFSSEMAFGEIFTQHISGIGIPILWHAIFMLITVVVISAGVVSGIQKAAKTLMPLLFILLLTLVFRSVTLEGAGEGLKFYLSPDFSQITPQSILDAIGQAFFTLSLGMGAIITYGSYLSDKENIGDNAAYVAIFDTLIAVMAGFAIFPALFALTNVAPDAGPGLTFITLPAVFAEMPLGSFFGFIFFLLLSIAALTSAISLLETGVAWVVDEKNIPRKKAAIILGIIVFLVGIPPVLGYSTWDGFSFMGFDILDTYDWIANNIFLPLGGLLTSIFAGYVWKSQKVRDEANKVGGVINIGKWYGFLVKIIVPIAIILIMIVTIYQQFIA